MGGISPPKKLKKDDSTSLLIIRKSVSANPNNENILTRSSSPKLQEKGPTRLSVKSNYSNMNKLLNTMASLPPIGPSKQSNVLQARNSFNNYLTQEPKLSPEELS